mmetsp:Transcript_22361/g.55614  ORF Transcript_22361/g.55614 Transcript_22361/m.55614 type:complete len:211 (-) Transcript_22361:189-821(-)
MPRQRMLWRRLIVIDDGNGVVVCSFPFFTSRIALLFRGWRLPPDPAHLRANRSRTAGHASAAGAAVGSMFTHAAVAQPVAARKLDNACWQLDTHLAAALRSFTQHPAHCGIPAAHCALMLPSGCGGVAFTPMVHIRPGPLDRRPAERLTKTARRSWGWCSASGIGSCPDSLSQSSRGGGDGVGGSEDAHAKAPMNETITTERVRDQTLWY